MNQIEKLAYEWAEMARKGSHMSYSLDPFVAGFRAARELAAQILKDWDISWYEEDTKLAAQLHDRWIKIENLGEEEI